MVITGEVSEMAALPYMQLYVADYLSDTAHLTTEEHGAYLLLLFNYWQTAKPLRADRLSSIARLTNERWTDVEQTLKEFFHVSKGSWVHLRVEADLAKVDSKSKKNSDAGKASAKAKLLAKQALEESDLTNVATNVEQTYQRNVNHTRSGDTDTDKNKDQDQELLGTAVAEPPKKSAGKKPADVVAAEQLISEGCDPDHVRDWLAVRKSKRAKLTPTAWKRMCAEAAKAGITVANAVQIAAERGWQAFDSSYNWRQQNGFQQAFGQGGGTGRPSLIAQVHAAQAEQERRRQLAFEPVPGTDEWEREFANIREIDGSIVGVDD